MPAPQLSCCAPIPSAAHARDVFGGRTLVLPGILVGLWRAAGQCGAMRGHGCQGCRPQVAAWKGWAAGGSGGRREGRGAEGLGGAAADSPVEREICSQAHRRHLQTTPAPLAQHGTAAAQGGEVHPANTPSPAAPHNGTARGGGKERAARGPFSWPGSARPYTGAFSITLRMLSQAGREPGDPAHSGPHLLGAQGPPLSGSSQDGGSSAPQGSACIQTLPVFMGAAGPGQRGAKSSPSPANKMGIQGREKAAAPGRPGPPVWPVGRGISPPGRAFTTRGLLSTRCARHTAARTQPCGAASLPACGGEWVPWRGQGQLDVPRVVIPKLPAHPALCSTLCVPPCAAPCTLRCMWKLGSALGVSTPECC